MKLKRKMAGQYQTLDGRYSVEYHDDYTHECGCITCQNGYTEHGLVNYARWIIWDHQTGDYATFSTEQDGYDTKTEAVAELERGLAGENGQHGETQRAAG